MALFVKKMVNGSPNACFLLDLLTKQYNYYMKYLAVLCIGLFCTLQMFGQQPYFMYLQTDNSQPFYLRMNGKVYSSTASGYLILSKIADSSYNVTIGFPRNVYPEQQFNIPAVHQDAGYVLKNFSDKGWGLFNLQTAAIIMTLTAPEEKKKPEIAGTRRNDAFSMLLANAVNDTTVLYIVNRPRPAAPVVVSIPKKDTAAVQQRIQPLKDSLVAKKKPAKADSIAITKNTAVHSAAPDPKNASLLAKGKRTTPSARNNKPARDSVATVKTVVPPTKPEPKKDSAIIVKTNTAQAKDSIAKTKHPLAVNAGKPGIAKNNKQRKDTIIIMNGNKTVADKPVARNNQPVQRDSVQVIKKEIMQAPEEKRDALQNNKDAVIIQKVPVKNDTAETVVKSEPVRPAEPNKDSLFATPVKRLRPLVNKAAELFTDTSYIAVFVDESKEKFDTIRISIPFNETAAFSTLTNPLKKLPDSASLGNQLKENAIRGTVAQSAPATVKKNDAVINSNTVRDSSRAENTQPTINGTKTDSVNKTPDSSRLKEQVTNPVQLDSPAAERKHIDTATQHMAIATGKKDSATVPGNPPAAKKDTSSTIVQKDSMPAEKVPAKLLLMTNSDCKEVALDADIDKLRIKMLLMNNDEDRIALAKKVFKQKCFLSKHVRALSELFPTDEGKYKWFDASYAYVSDSGNFSLLGELIKDEYFLNRFKAMLRH